LIHFYFIVHLRVSFPSFPPLFLTAADSFRSFLPFYNKRKKKKKHLHLETTAAIHHSIVFIYPIENASRSEKKKKTNQLTQRFNWSMKTNIGLIHHFLTHLCKLKLIISPFFFFFFFNRV